MSTDGVLCPEARVHTAVSIIIFIIYKYYGDHFEECGADVSSRFYR